MKTIKILLLLTGLSISSAAFGTQGAGGEDPNTTGYLTDKAIHDLFWKNAALGPAQVNGASILNLLRREKNALLDNTTSKKRLETEKVFGFYFAYQGSDTCNRFTARLVKKYFDFRKKGIEIIFVSSDLSPLEFNDHFRKMPWLSVLPNYTLCRDLRKMCGMYSLPSLTFVRTLDGASVTNGCELIDENVPPNKWFQDGLPEAAKEAKNDWKNHVGRLTREKYPIHEIIFDDFKHKKNFRTMEVSIELPLLLTSIINLHQIASKHFMQEKQFVDVIEYYQRLVALRHFRDQNISWNADLLNDVYNALDKLNNILDVKNLEINKQTVPVLARKLVKESDDLARALCNMGKQIKIDGLMYEQCGALTDSLEFYELALLIHKNYSADKLAVASILGEIASILTYEKHFNEAIACYTKALEIEKELRSSWAPVIEDQIEKEQASKAKICKIEKIIKNKINTSVEWNHSGKILIKSLDLNHNETIASVKEKVATRIGITARQVRLFVGHDGPELIHKDDTKTLKEASISDRAPLVFVPNLYSTPNIFETFGDFLVEKGKLEESLKYYKGALEYYKRKRQEATRQEKEKAGRQEQRKSCKARTRKSYKARTRKSCKTK